MPAMQASVDNTPLPEPVRAPAGHKVSMVTTGAGEITYECREKKDTAGQFEWAFVGPVATLADRSGKIVGKYYGGPTWEAADGSRSAASKWRSRPTAAATSRCSWSRPILPWVPAP